MSILITGFDPFGGEHTNPSWEAVQRLPESIAGVTLHKRQLPTVFDRAGETLKAAIAELRPDAVLAVGQAGGRAAITVERVAVNLRDARIPDNAGRQCLEEPIRAGGPVAYFSTLPTRAMVESIRTGGLLAMLSYTAGTFVCNDVLYTMLDLEATEHIGFRGGFVHVPFLPEQTVEKPGQPSMALNDICRGLELALMAVVKSGIPAQEIGILRDTII